MRRTMLGLAGLLALATGLGVAHASEPQSPSPPSTELEVVEQGFQWLGALEEYGDTDVQWGAFLHNPNTDGWVASGSVEVTFTDAGGNVVGTHLDSFSHLGPDETRAVGSWLGYVTAEPVEMTIEVTEVNWTDQADLSPGELTASIVSDTMTTDGVRHVAMAIRSTLETDASASPHLVLRDNSGKLLGVREGWAAVPAGAEVGEEENFFYVDSESSANMSVEADVDWNEVMVDLPTGVLPLEVVEVGGGWYVGTGEGDVSWGALIRNPNDDGWVAQGIQVTTTFRDAAGVITGSDFNNGIGAALPGQTIGVGSVSSWAPESASIDVSVVASWVHFEAVPAPSVTFVDAALQHENGELSGVTATMTVPEAFVDETGIDIGVIYRDATGQIVGGNWGFEIPAATTSSIEIPEFTRVTGVASVELYPSYYTDIPSQPAPAADTGQFRPAGDFSPEVAANIPAPSDVSTDPPVVYANLILAALAVLALTIGVRLLNTTLVAHEDALEGLIRPAKALGAWWGRADQAVAGHLGRASEIVRVGGVLLFYGVLFSFLEPGWRPWTMSGLFVLFVMTIAFGAVGTGDDLVELRSARRWGMPARLVVKPALVLFAVGSVALTKVAGLVPGLLIGTPEAFSMEDEVSERDEARLAVVGLGSTAAIGLGAWALASPLDGMLDGSGGFAQGALSALVTLLVLIFAVAVENLFANLLAFPGSEGAALRRRSRIGWWIMMLAVTALFFHTLINPAGDLGESMRSTNVRVVLATVAVFLLFTVSVWWWFRRHDQQQPPAGSEPAAEPATAALPAPVPVPVLTGAPAPLPPPHIRPFEFPPPVPREEVHSELGV